MDAKRVKIAVDRAITRERERASALREAERFVRPIVGDLALSFDSAEELYRHTLELKGISTKDLHPSAYRPLLERLPKPGQGQRPQQPRIAQDGAGRKSFAERFPGAARVQRM